MGLAAIVAMATSLALVSERLVPDYPDESLRVVLDAAARHHPLIKQRLQELRVEREELGVAFAAYLPTVSVEGRLLATERDAVLQTGEDFDEETTQKSASVSVQQVLYNGGRRGLEQHIAKLRFRIAQQELEFTRRDILGQVVNDLHRLEAARQALVQRRILIDLLEEQVRAATARERVGDASQTDITIANSRLHLARASIAQTEFELVTALDSLMSMTGLPPNDLNAPQFSDLNGPPIDRSIDRAIRGDPRVVAAALRAQVAEANQRLAQKTNAPVLGLAATASTAREVSPAIDESDEVSVGLTLSVPLYRGGLGSSERRKSLAAARAALFAEREARRQAELELKRLIAEYDAAHAALLAARRRASAASSATEGFLAGQKAGFYTTLDALDAIEDQVAAEISVIEARSRMGSVAARINIYLGGNV